MTDGAGDFLIAEDIYPNKAYNDQDETQRFRYYILCV